MPDLDHLWGEDLSVSASGDISVTDGDDLTRERILRRLMTGEGEYIWNLTYGASVPQRVGQVNSIDLITSVIQSQMSLESSVARNPAPTITVTEILNGVSVYILFYSAQSGQQQTLSFDVNS